MPGAPQPMLATAGELPVGPGWAYEFKWDGVRALAVVDGRADAPVRPVRGRDHQGLPGARRAGRGPGRGRPHRRRARRRGRPAGLRTAGPTSSRWPNGCTCATSAGPAQLAATHAGELHDLRHPLGQRHRVSVGALCGPPPAARVDPARRWASTRWAVPPQFTDGEATVEAARELALEGVVAKRLSSTYRPGARSPDWIKIKHEQTGDYVVGGWRPGRRELGALLVGAVGPDGLTYRGRVGGGISASAERDLLARLRPLRATDVAVRRRAAARGRQRRQLGPAGTRGRGAVRQHHPRREAALPAVSSGCGRTRRPRRPAMPEKPASGSGCTSTAGSWSCPTWTRCCIRRTGSPRARSSTTTSGWRRCCCRTWPTGRSPGSATRTGWTRRASSRRTPRRHARPGSARQRLPVPGSSTGRETLDFIVVDGVATLAWLANLAAIELHTPQWRLAGERAGQPGPARGRPRSRAAGRARRVLPGRRGRQAPARAGRAAPLAKTSGKKGMQLLARLRRQPVPRTRSPSTPRASPRT